MFNRYLALVVTLLIVCLVTAEKARSEALVCAHVFDVIVTNLLPEGLSAQERVQREFNILESYGPSRLGLDLEQIHFVDKAKRWSSLPASERFAIGLAFEQRNQNFSYESITRYSPGQVMDIFTYWVALGFPHEALRFFQANQKSFLVYTQHKVFFLALRDILHGNTQSAEVLEVRNLILDYRSTTMFMSKYLYGEQVVGAIAEARELKYRADIQVYNRYQIDMKNSLQNLAYAWLVSPEAQRWVESLAPFKESHK